MSAAVSPPWPALRMALGLAALGTFTVPLFGMTAYMALTGAARELGPALVGLPLLAVVVTGLTVLASDGVPHVPTGAVRWSLLVYGLAIAMWLLCFSWAVALAPGLWLGSGGVVSVLTAIALTRLPRAARIARIVIGAVCVPSVLYAATIPWGIL
ncbi:hypothetical protein ACQEU3_18565 [Spirillospora sp. CA-253888]